MNRLTFDAICEKRGEPIAVFEISAHPERTMESFSINPDPSKVAVWKISDEFEGGIIIYCTWGNNQDAEWYPNSGHRQLVAHLLADRDRLRSELDAARADLARVRRQLLRRMELGTFRVWSNLPPRRQTRKNALRLHAFQCACRAELARMGKP